MFKKTKSDKLNKYKILTQWLIGKNKLPVDQIVSIIDNNYKYRLFSYLIKHPTLMYYLNENLNSIKAFDKFSDEEWLCTFRDIFERYNIDNLNHVYFAKYKQPKRQSIRNTFEHLNDSDIIEYQRLSDAKIITSNVQPIKINLPEVDKPKENIDFNKRLIKYISNRVSCKNCPLFLEKKYPVITNKQEDSIIDGIIIGEYPVLDDEDDVLHLIKSLFKKYNLIYLHTNLVVCKPSTDEIPNKNKTISNCQSVINHISGTFNSSFKILLGSTVKSKYSIKGPITKLNGEVVNNHFIMNYPFNNSNSLNTAISNLDNFLKNYSSKKIKRANLEAGLVEIPSTLKNKTVTTLFDIKIIEDNLLYILLDENGKKHYIKEEISFPVYIKTGKFKDCGYMIDKPDFVVYLTNQQRQMLYGTLSKDLHTRIVDLKNADNN